jgi:hypothetical protein
MLLLPEAVDDYVAADNPVRFIEAFVDGLDLAALGFIGTVPKEALARFQRDIKSSHPRDFPIIGLYQTSPVSVACRAPIGQNQTDWHPQKI